MLFQHYSALQISDLKSIHKLQLYWPDSPRSLYTYVNERLSGILWQKIQYADVISLMQYKLIRLTLIDETQLLGISQQVFQLEQLYNKKR